MTFDEYQEKALTTGRDKDKKDEIFHRVLGLVGEAGEIAEKIKKIVRDHDSDLSKLDKEDIKKELGDVLWYTAVLADYFNLSFADVATFNLAKLQSRKRRGTLQGSGDNR